ncbi:MULTISPECIES: hypothetical protein [Cupriavidus]|uniref:Uncharacterized protein n=1 Tax=Cupriavidus taiwanensis TaxID=164546 RepID=A0A375HES6_9BURK|nr:hypothetical protein [Cupriavidus taiwanensis]SPD48889.1 protein of unknown function [Cupriavidus taiwanensis]
MQAIKALFPDRLKEYCNELAHHYRQSGNVPKAVEYLKPVGKAAFRPTRSGWPFQKRARTAQAAPDTPDRIQEELTLLLTLGPAGDDRPQLREVLTIYVRASR